VARSWILYSIFICHGSYFSHTALRTAILATITHPAPKQHALLVFCLASSPKTINLLEHDLLCPLTNQNMLQVQPVQSMKDIGEIHVFEEEANIFGCINNECNNHVACITLETAINNAPARHPPYHEPQIKMHQVDKNTGQ
jgi:hypothetical protein